ncbi:MAG: type II toxin-antitoxin system RelE/ParE family toxin [Candidatus Eremiobacteraeota bacterium]|nr:type II toxin-antitoxin system RelE/ParE family toxin [Candidatus Eremiobacteraeota bacterium]
MSWSVRFTTRAARDVESLADADRRVILAAVRSFAGGAIADVKKLHGRPDYRLRVGRFRVLYTMGAGELLVLRVLDRKDAYR